MSGVQLEFWRAINPLLIGGLYNGEYTSRPAASAVLKEEYSAMTDQQLCEIAWALFNSEGPGEEPWTSEYEPVGGVSILSLSVGDVIGVWRPPKRVPARVGVDEVLPGIAAGLRGD